MEQSIPTGWQVKGICDVCDVYQPQTISGKEMQNGGDFPVFGANGLIGHYTQYNHEEAEVLLGCRGSCGAVNFSNPYSWINGNAMVVHPNSAELSKYYLKYFLENCDFSLYISGVATPQITRKSLSPLKIAYPSLAEQERIVEKLDIITERIERMKANAKFTLSSTKDLFESAIRAEMSKSDNWPQKLLSEVAIQFGRGKSKHRPRNDKSLYGGKYPFIQTGDIRNANHIITKYHQTYNEKGLAQSKLWPKGTLCITIAANIAETAILGFDSCFPDSVIGCVFDESKTNIAFVEYLLQSYKTILKAAGKGSAQDNINLATFEKHKFAFPDKRVQDQIVKRLDSLREYVIQLESVYKSKITLLEDLKRSILKQAFAGEL